MKLGTSLTRAKHTEMTNSVVDGRCHFGATDSLYHAMLKQNHNVLQIPVLIYLHLHTARIAIAVIILNIQACLMKSTSNDIASFGI